MVGVVGRRAIKTKSRQARAHPDRNLRREIGEGLRFVAAQPAAALDRDVHGLVEPVQLGRRRGHPGAARPRARPVARTDRPAHLGVGASARCSGAFFARRIAELARPGADDLALDPVSAPFAYVAPFIQRDWSLVLLRVRAAGLHDVGRRLQHRPGQLPAGADASAPARADERHHAVPGLGHDADRRAHRRHPGLDHRRARDSARRPRSGCRSRGCRCSSHRCAGCASSRSTSNPSWRPREPIRKTRSHELTPRNRSLRSRFRGDPMSMPFSRPGAIDLSGLKHRPAPPPPAVGCRPVRRTACWSTRGTSRPSSSSPCRRR